MLLAVLIHSSQKTTTGIITYLRSSQKVQKESTLPETNISPEKAIFEDDFPFPKVGYVNSLEGNSTQFDACLPVNTSASQKDVPHGSAANFFNL